MFENLQKISEIPGLVRGEIKGFEDERGTFRTSYRESDGVSLFEQGYALRPFVSRQSNHVDNHDQAIRGFHAEPWDKLVFMIRGSATVAYIDVRDAPEFGAVVSFILREGEMVLIPEGVGNSYLALGEGTVYAYHASAEWTEGLVYPMVNLFDPDLDASWTRRPEMIVGPKDEVHPSLRDAFPDLYAKWRGGTS